jgi:uncharacterized protein GlcG (DUF336 family)
MPDVQLRRPGVEPLEARNLPSVTTQLAGGLLTISGDGPSNNIRVSLDQAANQLVVTSFVDEVARFDAASVDTILIHGGPGQNVLSVDPDVTQATTIEGTGGDNFLRGGGGPTTLLGGAGLDKIIAGPGPTVIDGGAGTNHLFGVKPSDTVVAEPGDAVCQVLPPVVAPDTTPVILKASEVEQLLDRATAASASNDAIIAIVDRGGRVLGVRVENGVSPLIQNNNANLVFAVDGALALARTGAFFANNGAPLTSRTVQFISQSTITQREVESNPDITDPNSTMRGPGFVAPVGIKNHFPPNVQYTPQVDLFNIEGSNRDSIISPGPDHLRGTADDIPLPARFNIDPAFYNPAIPTDEQLAAPESYGYLSGLEPNAQSRGIGTLPGGIPIYKDGQLVGGIGVFFPGTTGYATEENSALSQTYDPSKPDRSFEAEAIAFEAVGGIPGTPFAVGNVGGVAPVPGIGLILPPPGRIDLVGITLDIFGPHGNEGPGILLDEIHSLQPGNKDAGYDLPVSTNPTDKLHDSIPVPDGWIVLPHDGVGITAAEVDQIVETGIAQANQTRAAIRLPLSSTTRMVFAVTDLDGNIVGLYRMPDATVFSLDVAVAKARNVAYYANPAKLQPIDQTPGVPPGYAFTNRSFRYLALPRFPEGIDGAPPGPFSILNDGGTNPVTALNTGPPLPASAFQSVQGFDAFNPQSNFHDPYNVANQNGIVFFPGSAPLYAGGGLIGGFGVSGDGVDQDDVVTTMGAAAYQPPPALRIDQVMVRGVRVPYNKFNRNPEGV